MISRMTLRFVIDDGNMKNSHIPWLTADIGSKAYKLYAISD